MYAVVVVKWVRGGGSIPHHKIVGEDYGTFNTISSSENFSYFVKKILNETLLTHP